MACSLVHYLPLRFGILFFGQRELGCFLSFFLSFFGRSWEDFVFTLIYQVLLSPKGITGPLTSESKLPVDRVCSCVSK